MKIKLFHFPAGLSVGHRGLIGQFLIDPPQPASVLPPLRAMIITLVLLAKLLDH